LGIMWGALIGITIQFFINMEVERYALINGESIFVGFARLYRFLPLWFVFSTFIGFGWPGIGLAGATVLSHVIPIASSRTIGIILFLLIGIILTFGKELYRTVESLQKWLIGVGVPFILFLTWYVTDTVDFTALMAGLVGQGEGYCFLPEGLVLVTFLGALAYSGAGGNLNLAQSFYVRDKGYAMGAYADKITSLFRSKEPHKKIKLEGSTFEPTKENITQFSEWWKIVNIEHAVVFWFLGLCTMLLLALLSYSTTFGSANVLQGIDFVIEEGMVIAQSTFAYLGVLFLVVIGIMLSATQLTVLDSTSRIITENILLVGSGPSKRVSLTYYLVLWFQIAFGISTFLLGFDQPLLLITLGAVLNACAMFVYIGLLLWLNNTRLHPKLRPGFGRNIVLGFSFVFFGIFSFVTILRFVVGT